MARTKKQKPSVPRLGAHVAVALHGRKAGRMKHRLAERGGAQKAWKDRVDP